MGYKKPKPRQFNPARCVERSFEMIGKAFVNGHVEQTTDFDYEEIDRRLGGASEPSAPGKVELVAAAKLLHHIVIVGGTNPRETMLWINVFLFVMGIHPNQNDSGTEIAEGMKTSKEEWFRRVSRMRQILSARGLFLPKIAGQWGASGKASVANSAIRSWQKRGGQPMLRIGEADKKLNWIAEHFAKLKVEELTPMARQELKAKLLPVVNLQKKL